MRKGIDKATQNNIELQTIERRFALPKQVIIYRLGINIRQTSSSFKLDDSRIDNKWLVAKEGIPFIVVSAGVTLLFVCFSLFSYSVGRGVAAGIIYDNDFINKVRYRGDGLGDQLFFVVGGYNHRNCFFEIHNPPEITDLLV